MEQLAADSSTSSKTEANKNEGAKACVPIVPDEQSRKCLRTTLNNTLKPLVNNMHEPVRPALRSYDSLLSTLYSLQGPGN